MLRMTSGASASEWAKAARASVRAGSKNSLAKTPGADIIFPTKIEHGASGMPIRALRGATEKFSDRPRSRLQAAKRGGVDG